MIIIAIKTTSEEPIFVNIFTKIHIRYHVSKSLNISPDSSNSTRFPPDESNFSFVVNKTVAKAKKVLAGRYICKAELYNNEKIKKSLNISVCSESLVTFSMFNIAVFDLMQNKIPL